MENYISSTKNQRIKDIKKLSEAKHRKKSGLFLVEGYKCVFEASQIDGLVLELIILEEDQDRYEDIISKVDNITFVSKEVLNYISESKTPQSIMCVCERQALNIETNDGMIVVLDSVSDPGNVGAIIRTADAVLASKIMLVGACADYLSPKVIRASMGSVFHVDIQRYELSDIVALKDDGYSVIGGHLKGDTDFSVDVGKTCIVIGNEARGISDEMSDILDVKVKIPIYGKAESLNAAVAASILMYKAKGY